MQHFKFRVVMLSSSDNPKPDVNEVNGSFKETLERTLGSSPVTSGRKNILIKDDPNCPNVFKVDRLKKKAELGNRRHFPGLGFQKRYFFCRTKYLKKKTF
jgi:hypothetical protein